MVALRSASRALPLLSGCLLLVVLWGCSSPNTDTPGRSVAPSPGASASQTSSGGDGGTSTPSCPAPVPSTITVREGVLADGKRFGFVHHFDGTSLYFDPAEMFEDEAATTAAREDGEIGPGEDLPNPFYIRNRETGIIRVPVSAKLSITLMTSRGSSLSPHHRTASEFAALYCSADRPDWLYANPEELPMNLVVVNGQVTRADEQYLP